MKIASIHVDAQNGFTELCPLELPVQGALKIVPALKKQDGFANYLIASKDEHEEGSVWEASDENPMGTPVKGHIDVDLHWNKHCVKNTFGAQLIEGLPQEHEYDLVIRKGQEKDCHPYGALWHNLAKTRSTGIIEFLNTKGVEVVIVGGLALDFCVKTTVEELLAAGFKTVLNLEATKAVFPENLEKTLAELKSLGCYVATTVEQLEETIESCYQPC